MGTLMYEIFAPGVNGEISLCQKMVYATIYNIISLDIRLNGTVAQVDLTRSLTFRMKSSISGTCYFLDEKFGFMSRDDISLHSGSNSKSVCICVILKSRCR